MAKYCKYCGRELRDNALFCSGCGKSTAVPTFQEPKAVSAKPEKKPKEKPKRQPKEKPQKQAKEKPQKKRKPLFGGINFILVLTLIIQAAVAGFKWPGYLTKRTGSPGQQLVALLEKEELPDQEALLKELESIDYEALAKEEYPITKETSPGNPALIEATWSQEEIRNAKAEEKAFTWEEAYAEVSTGSGPVSVEFNGWDLDEDEDSLIVRTLGSKKDSASEMTLHGYDLSLESGQHEFTSHNIITIPRMSGDDRDSYVAWYNPDTGEYEPVYYEISEDRKSYRVFLDHFSTVVEAIPNYLRPDFYNGNVFYEPEHENRVDPMDRWVALSEEALDKWAKTGAVDLLKMSESGISNQDVLASSLGMIDVGNNFDDLLKLGDAAAKAGILKTIAGNLGYATIMVKSLYQTTIDGKISGFGKAFTKDNWQLSKDLASNLAVTIGGMLMKKGAASAVGAAALTVGIPVGALLIGVSITYTVYGLLDIVLKVLGEPPFAGTDVYMLRYQEYLKKMKATVTYEDSQWNVALGGFKVLDPLTRSEKDTMYLLCRSILTKYGNDPELARSMLESITTQYVHYYWYVAEKDVRARWYAARAIDARDETFAGRRLDHTWEEFYAERDSIASIYQDPDKDTIDSYCNAHMDYVTKQVDARVRAVIRDNYINSKVALKLLLQNKVVPLMNERIFFTVIDANVNQGENFDKSEFSGYEPGKAIKDYADNMTFMKGKLKESTYLQTKPMLCIPTNRKKSDYTAESVQPYPRENSDVIFTCTRFHYTQMGAPEEIVLTGKNGKQVHLPIKDIPPAQNGVVKVELEIKPDLSRFNGIWVQLDMKEKFIKGEMGDEWIIALLYIPSFNAFCEFEGPIRTIGWAERWTIVRNPDYNAKTKEVTIDFVANNDIGIDTGVFRIAENGNMILRNRTGTTEFFKFKDINP